MANQHGKLTNVERFLNIFLSTVPLARGHFEMPECIFLKAMSSGGI